MSQFSANVKFLGELFNLYTASLSGSILKIAHTKYKMYIIMYHIKYLMIHIFNITIIIYIYIKIMFKIKMCIKIN